MLTGRLDRATRRQIAGWARETDLADAPVVLLVTANGEFLDRIVANRYRDDPARHGVGDGRHGFLLDFAEGLDPLRRHAIRVCRESDGADLPGSPVVIEAATSFDDAAADSLAALLQAAAGPDDINARIAFLERQIARLARRLGDAEARRDGRQRALVIDSRAPATGHDAGSSALLSHMASLARLGFAVEFAGADDEGDITAPEGVRVHARPSIRSIEELLAREAGRFDLVYLHRVGIAARYLPLVRHHQPKARLLYSVADLHHLRLARQAAVESRAPLAALARRVQATEFALAGAADATITHSPVEAALLRRAVPGANIHVVPWAVPTMRLKTTLARRHGIGFIGHFDHAPNLDAARRLAFEIMPRLRKDAPDMTCLIAGSAMPAEMRRWQADGVEVLGAIDDLRGLFERIRLTVAPMAYGAGIKGKILDSLAAGLPCVASPVAAEGLPGSFAPCLVVAGDDDAFAKSIIALHDDRAALRRAAKAGPASITETWSEAAVDAALGAAVGIVAAKDAAAA